MIILRIFEVPPATLVLCGILSQNKIELIKNNYVEDDNCEMAPIHNEVKTLFTVYHFPPNINLCQFLDPFHTSVHYVSLHFPQI